MGKKITVLIPCYNEAESIETVIRKFPRKQLEKLDFALDILVIDNNSSDNTAEIARKAGARVIVEKKKGKGNAIRTAFRSIPDDAEYVAMIDGDDTYSPEEILRLVEPLHNNFTKVVIGSRLGGRMTKNAMRPLNLAGNWIYTHLVRYSYRVNVTDVLTGYFAWKRDVVHKLEPHLESDGFAIEMEMITKMARMGHEIYSVPISYHPRIGESNLRPFYDGWRILKMYARNLFWRPQPVLRTDEGEA